MKQVLSIEQMQHLKELGIDISKASCYIWYAEDKEYLYWGKCEDNNGTPIFTLQDILDLLPATIDDDYRLYIDKGLVLWTVGYVDAVSEEIYEDFRERDLIDTAYKMLCWIIKNNYLNIKE